MSDIYFFRGNWSNHIHIPENKFKKFCKEHLTLSKIGIVMGIIAASATIIKILITIL